MTDSRMWILFFANIDGGPDSLAQLEAKHGRLPIDPAFVIKGSRGSVAAFQAPDGATPDKTVFLAPGITCQIITESTLRRIGHGFLPMLDGGRQPPTLTPGWQAALGLLSEEAA